MLLPLAASPNLKVIAIAEDNTHIGHRLGGIETELTWKPLPRGLVFIVPKYSIVQQSYIISVIHTMTSMTI